MDNKKVGDLIADLRKKKGLTQKQLAELVGITPTSVSKWERGINTPDKGLLNDLCQILDTSLSTLLTGEVKKELTSDTEEMTEETIENCIKNDESKVEDDWFTFEENTFFTRKPNSLIVKLFIIISIILIFISIFIIYNKNKMYVYNLLSLDEDCYVEGKVIFRDDKLSMVVNKIKFRDEEFNSVMIKNYEYDVSTNGNYLFGFGYIDLVSSLDMMQSIRQFSSNFNINYHGYSANRKNEILENNLTITLRFLDYNDEEIYKEINVLLVDIKEDK